MVKGKGPDRRGSFTVEAALVMSVVMMTLVLLVFAFLLMYQKLMLVSTASLLARQGAASWTDSRKSLTGKINPQQAKDDLYYRLLEDAFMGEKTIRETMTEDQLTQKLKEGVGDLENRGLPEAKLKQLQLAVCQEMARRLKKPRLTTVETKYTNRPGRREISITISQELETPFGAINLSGQGVAVVSEPSEYVRSLDLALEYASRLKTPQEYSHSGE